MNRVELARECVSSASEAASQSGLRVERKDAKSRAYILVETVMGKSLEVSQALRGYDWADTVERMVGAFDIMVEARDIAEGRTPERVKSIVEQIDGVLRVVVCPLYPAIDPSRRS